jgi:hypothetical protein
MVFRNMIMREGWGYVRWTDVPLYTRWTGSCQAADVGVMSRICQKRRARICIQVHGLDWHRPLVIARSGKASKPLLLPSNIMTRAFTCSGPCDGRGRERGGFGNGGGIPPPCPAQDRDRIDLDGKLYSSSSFDGEFGKKKKREGEKKNKG